MNEAEKLRIDLDVAIKQLEANQLRFVALQARISEFEALVQTQRDQISKLKADLNEHRTPRR